MSGLPDGLDVLSLQSSPRAISARIGGVELGPALRNANVQTRLNDLPTASIQLDPILLAGKPVDYFGVVEVGGHLPTGQTRTLFTGNVMTAAATGDQLELDWQTHSSLTETMMGGLELLNAHPGEMLHMLTRAGGLREDQIHVQGLEQLPLEVIEVLLPITGLTVREPVMIGPITLLDPAETEPLWRDFEDSPLRRELLAGECHALYRQVGQRLLDVEERALGAVDVALAWLVSRARYGLAFLPDGTPQRFTRSKALSRPTRTEVVLAKALESGRAWLRTAQPAGGNKPLELRADDLQWLPPDPENISTSLRLALLALRRAASTLDALQRIGALWEAIEFYAAGVRAERRFSSADAKRVRKAVPKDLDPELHGRVMALLAKINDPPLMVKLRDAAERDGAPLTESETELLKRVRVVRNDTAHGRDADLPDSADVDYAVSLVARLVLHRLVGR
jgi:hypothetical protein